MNTEKFIPTTREELIARHGVSQPDFIFVSGDAYVDHPSFANGLLVRLIEHWGYTVGIIAQPNVENLEDIQKFGPPKYAFLVSAGNLDSMVAHYTANKKPRSEDYYSPGGVKGKRPDRATLAYVNLIRRAYKGAPVVIGGIEASLRRFSHYDYWSDTVRHSILADSKADLLIYGMGERALKEICDALASGIDIKDITWVRGTVFMAKDVSNIEGVKMLPSHSEVKSDKKKYCEAVRLQHAYTCPYSSPVIAEESEGRYIVANPPAIPLDGRELDEVYELPYTRLAHPSYDAMGGVPALNEVKFSVVSCRGCFGDCAFCSITMHQGRAVTARTHESIMREVRLLTKLPDFKGYIHDVGGPSANFRGPSCKGQLERGICHSKRCLAPTPCKNLEASSEDYRELLRKLRGIEGVKKIFIRSGIRYDYLMESKGGDALLRDIVKYHVSGQLKVAPEHASDKVLKYMGKPSVSVFDKFTKKFNEETQRAGLKQYIVPYFICSHPGCTLEEAIELALYLKKTGFVPDSVQDFYPTPGAISTCMYYTGLDPYTLKEVYIPKGARERAYQRALLQFNKPENRKTVIEALKLCHREDLIGFSRDCLVAPTEIKRNDSPKERVKNGKDKNKGYSGKSRR